MKGQQKWIIVLSLLVLTLFPLIAGGGQEPIPSVNFRKAPTFISPGSANGELLLEIEAEQVENLESIKVFELNIFDKNGEVVFRQEATVTDSRTFLQRTFATQARPVIALPDNIRWNGQNQSGAVVSDDVYFYQLGVKNDEGRGSATPPLQVVVDTRAPEVLDLTSNVTLFSPNGDGVRDTITFTHRTGPALTWNYSIQTSTGQKVWEAPATQADTNPTASDVVASGSTIWDGVANVGSTGAAPNGEYQFVIDGIDRAGNQITQALPFRLNTDTGDVRVYLEDSDLRYFSPEASGSLPLQLEVSRTEGITSWTLEIRDKDAIVVRRFTGQGPLPSSVVFTGKGNPGRPETETLDLPEGEYLAELSILYANGNNPISGPLQITIDRTAPRAGITLATQPTGTELGFPVIFGGDQKTHLNILVNADETVEWNLVALYQDEERYEIPLSVLTNAGVTFPHRWDGTLPSAFARQYGFQVPEGVQNVPLPDGLYQFTLEARDRAGNLGVSNPARFIKDTADRSDLRITVSETLLTPGQDGADSTQIRVLLNNVENLETMSVSLAGTDNRAYFIRTSRDFIPLVIWDGSRSNGIPAPDGEYRAEAELRFMNGDLLRVVSDTSIALGSAPLVGRVRVSPELFSPDDDGSDDVLTITTDTSASSRPVARWVLDILDPVGNPFRQWSGSGTPPATLIWDGTSESGELVQSASDYFVQLTIFDEFGSRHLSGAGIATDVLVMREGDRLRILIPSIIFAGNTSSLFAVENGQRTTNLVTLRRLAGILNRYSDYRIRIEGHAVQVLWNDSARAAAEQRNELIPLSRNRATEVRKALTILGVDWNRMSIEGFGGSRPIVPHSDLENRWKNRRVEFILEK